MMIPVVIPLREAVLVSGVWVDLSPRRQLIPGIDTLYVFDGVRVWVRV